MKRWATRAAAGALLLFLAIQFVRPEIPRGGPGTEIQAPPEVRAVLERDCYACHSNQPRLSWFDHIQPIRELARRDILAARARLNFSTLGAKPPAAQRAALFESVAMMRLGAMPLPPYTALHPEAKVTLADLELLERYLAPWSTPIPPVSAAAEAAPPAGRNIPPAPNGLAYDAGWNRWRLLALTDRGDNRQFRMILGNDAAIEAARANRITPWPDGARLAKAAWLQERAADGRIVPGAFWQVELMVKDAAARPTEGWQWGRWRGAALKPYGDNPGVVAECTGCHRPVAFQDYVYTLPFTTAARMPAGLGFDPLDWTPLTIFLDPAQGPAPGTVSVLFAGGADEWATTLVTWTQRDDPTWFGARIADRVARVEQVRRGPNGPPAYRRWEGEAAAAAPLRASDAERTQLIIELKPAPRP